MKKYIWILVGVILLGAVVFHFGNKPLVTYYLNGQIESSTPRRFFTPHGLASFYNKDGTLSKQCTFQNGVKNGVGYIYFAGQALKVNYENGVLSGTAIFENEALAKDFLNPKITFLPDNMLNIALSENDTNAVLKAKRLCDDDTLIDNLQAYTKSFNKADLKDVLPCLSLQKATLSNNDNSCEFEGNYTYPKLMSNFELNCNGNYKNPLINADKVALKATYSLAKDKLSFEIVDKQNSKSRMETSYGGLNKILEGVSQMLVNSKEDEYFSRFLWLILENFTSSDSVLNINGQKVWEVLGNFNIMTGFSDPYYISSYMDGQVTSQFKINASGLNVKALYPISKKPMISFGFTLSDSFKTVYKKLIKDVSAALVNQFNPLGDGGDDLFANIENYANDLKNMFQNFYGTLYNNKGQKVISAVAGLKEGADADELMFSPITAFKTSITTYENNEVAHQIIGDFENGFLVDGQPATEDDVFALVSGEYVLQTISEIGDELKQKFDPLLENGNIFENVAAVDPFLLGVYFGYMQATQNDNAEQMLEFSDEVPGEFSDEMVSESPEEEIVNQEEFILKDQ